MNYYYDCEFLEGKQDKRFLGIKYGETKPTIDLISIGIVSENFPLKNSKGEDSRHSSSREYYVISKDFNLKEAWNRCENKREHIGGGWRNYKIYWIRENVLKPIFKELTILESKVNQDLGHSNIFNYKNLKRLILKYGKTNKQIADDLKEIVSVRNEKYTGTYPNTYAENVNLYGYYSAYDHVVFCWLFGKMIDLPKGFPMYTKDLKQILDEKVMSMTIWTKDADLNFRINSLKNDKELGFDYPKQENEHSAIHDARWNKKLHEFLTSL